MLLSSKAIELVDTRLERSIRMDGQLMMPVGELGEIIHGLVIGYGGYYDCHTHLDRSGTLDPSVLRDFRVNPLDVARSPLRLKQFLVGELHKSAYTKGDVKQRVMDRLKIMYKTGTRKVTSFIDATPDIGLQAIEAAIEAKTEARNTLGIELEIVPHPIFGFKADEKLDHEITRWELFEKACSMPEVSAVGALPEKDDRHDSVGSDGHIQRVLRLGIELGKPVYIHVGQANASEERNIFDVIEAVRWIGSPQGATEYEPTVRVIHNISASKFAEEDFGKQLRELKRYNIGVDVCPRAGISMRSRRAILSPTYNSIARVPEMLLAGVSVRIGNDNIADMFVPTGSGSMLTEVLFLADVLRFYDPHVLAKLAAGKPLNQNDRENVRKYLEEDVKVHKADDPHFKFCMPLDS